MTWPFLVLAVACGVGLFVNLVRLVASGVEEQVEDLKATLAPSGKTSIQIARETCEREVAAVASRAKRQRDEADELLAAAGIEPED